MIGRNNSNVFGGRGGGFREEGNFRTQQQVERRPPSPPRPAIVRRVTLPPMASFKSFMINQLDDVAPDVFQRRYEDFQLQYVIDCSQNFFDVNNSEEWFHERYDPLRHHEIEKETMKWATDENARFRNKVLEAPDVAIESCRLDPMAATVTQYHNDQKYVNQTSADIFSGEEGEQLLAGSAALEEPENPEDKIDKENAVVIDEGGVTDDVTLSKDTSDINKATLDADIDSCMNHVSGHQHCTLYLCGIPAECPKAVLRNIMTEAAGGTIERLIMGAPSWSIRPPSKGFEKNAWLILPKQSHATNLLKILRDLPVTIPGTPDPITGELGPGLFFELKAAIHAPSQFLTTPECMSTPHRVQYDLAKASELAELLDADRGILEESRLSVLFGSSSELAGKSPIEKLDLTIAYLRRVHFVVYYGCRRYRDEAHLLSSAPSIIRRSAPYVSASEDLGAAQTPTSTALTTTESATGAGPSSETEGVVEMKDEDHLVVVGRKREREEDGEEEEPPAKEQAVAADDDKEEGEEEVSSPRPRMSSQAGGPPSSLSGNREEWYRFPFIYSMDRRIEETMKDLRARASRKAAEKSTPEEEEVQTILAQQEQVIDTWAEELTKPEPEGKARCAIEWCAKLFKGPDFLKKHLRSKHLELISNRLQKVTIPYMLLRYDAEELLNRPLPLLPVETNAGTVELMSVKAILERCNRLPVMHCGVMGGGRGGFGGRDGRGRGRGMGMNPGGRVMGRMGDRRWSQDGMERGGGRFGPRDGSFQGRDSGEFRPGGGDRRHSTPFSRPMQQRPAEDGHSRVLLSYVDVDAPEMTSTALDYGVAVLPPPKKRKLSLKKEEIVAVVPASKE